MASKNVDFTQDEVPKESRAVEKEERLEDHVFETASYYSHVYWKKLLPFNPRITTALLLL